MYDMYSQCWVLIVVVMLVLFYVGNKRYYNILYCIIVLYRIVLMPYTSSLIENSCVL